MQHTTIANAALLALVSFSATTASTFALDTRSAIPVKFPIRDATKPGADAQRPTSDSDAAFVLNQMEELVNRGKPIAASLKDLGSVVDAMKVDQGERDAMSGAIDDLSDWSSQAFIEPADVQVLRKQFAYARIDGTLKRAAQVVSDAHWGVSRTTAEITPVTGGICTVYMPKDAEPMLAELQDAFAKNQQGAQRADAFLTGVRLTLVQSRMFQARALLAHRVRSSNTVRGNWSPIFRLLVLRAEILAESPWVDPD